MNLKNGQKLKFNLKANPTYRRNQRRYPWINIEDQVNWLKRKETDCGFKLLACDVIKKDQIKFKRKNDLITLHAVYFTGTLQIVNEKAFMNVVKYGAGNFMEAIRKMDQDKEVFNAKYNQPVFTDSQKDKLINNLGDFETWLIKIIK